jgi:hypothetical protein
MLEVAASIDQEAITTESFVIAESVTELNFRDASAHIRAAYNTNHQKVDRGINVSVNPISIHLIIVFFNKYLLRYK